MTRSTTLHRHVLGTIAAAALLGQALPAAAQAVDLHAWAGLGTTPTLAIGDTISTSQNLAKSNYGDNPALMNSAWAHAGGTPWYAFQLTSTADVHIDLTPVSSGASFAPGLTLWATGSSVFDGGSDGIETGPNNGWGAPHSFNAVGQVGDDGTLWASGANGNIQQTLAYAVTGPSHLDGSGNGWGEVIKSGVNDISTDNSFEHGVTGTATGNSIHLTASQLQTGWYLVFIGGTSNTGTNNTAYNLSVSALAPVPEPASWALLAAGLGLAGLRRIRRAR